MTRFLGGLVSIGIAIQLWYYAVHAWQIFLTDCPNNDFLSWDENIRLNIVIDQFADFRDGKIFRGIMPFFESPTWPPLRSLTTFFTLYLPIDSHLAIRDSFHGLFFLILVFPSVLFVSSKILDSFFQGSIVTFLVFVLTLQTTEVPVYSLSSMLETQSMFFLVWSSYALYKLYSEDLENQPISGSTKLLVSLGLFGFFFTKYPYGILFMMACFLVELIRKFSDYRIAFSSLAKHYFNWTRGIFLGSVGLAILSIPFLRLVSSINLNQKSFKQGLFYASLLVFLDLSYFFWKERKRVIQAVPKTGVVLWKFAILPALLWLFTNPDRVGSLLDAQLIVNAYTKSFFLTLWTEPHLDSQVPGIFDFIWGFRSLVVLGISAIGILAFRFRQQGKAFLTYPLVGVTLAIFLELLLLEISTGNKQPRHVLQFIPAATCLLLIWLLTFIEDLGNRRFFGYPVFSALAILIAINLVYNDGLWSGHFFTNKPFCYRGKEASIFQPAREIANLLEPNGEYLIFNLFHKKEKYDKPGRMIASDFDLAMKIRTFPKGKAKNDNPYIFKDWSEFKTILLLSDECPDAIADSFLEQRIKKTGSNPKLIETYRESSGIACLQFYSLEN